MPEYQLGGHNFSRKNLYLPCAISADLDSVSEEEQARIYRETRWADNITNAEWPLLLGKKVKPYVRSKLKRKAAAWLMPLTRIMFLSPELAVEIVDRTAEMSHEQTPDRGGGEPLIHWDVLAAKLREIWLPEVGDEEDERAA
jgi:hypothetical protein